MIVRLGIEMIDKNQLIDGIKHLEKKSQVELLKTLMQQLEPDVVSAAAEDVNIGNNNNSSITYAEIVLNLYLQDSEILANLLDAAAYRLRNKAPHPVE